MRETIRGRQGEKIEHLAQEELAHQIPLTTELEEHHHLSADLKIKIR